MPLPAGEVPAVAYRWLNPLDSSLVIDTVTGWVSKWAMAAREIVQQQGGQVPAEVLTDQDPLDGEVGDLPVSG